MYLLHTNSIIALFDSIETIIEQRYVTAKHVTPTNA